MIEAIKAIKAIEAIGSIEEIEAVESAIKQGGQARCHMHVSNAAKQDGKFV